MRKPSKNVGLRGLCASSKRAGMVAAMFLGLLSLMVIVSNFQMITFHFPQATNDRDSLEGPSLFFPTRVVQHSEGESILGPEDRSENEQMRKFLMDSNSPPLKEIVEERLHELTEPWSFKNRGAPPVSVLTQASIPPGPHHPCDGFVYPPPPADKKRTGPRPCPVCYLPMDQAIQAMPSSGEASSLVLKNLTFVREPNSTDPALAATPGSEFGGHPTLEDRQQSHLIRENMEVNCGFVKGSEPGLGSGFDISDEDRAEMHKCDGVVVGSAIFGNYDELQQPKNVSEEARKNVCFFMFVDEETAAALAFSDPSSARKVGLWNVVVVRNLPYKDARRNGKIPKLLIHRLFPNARFSLWVDGKLELVVDPYLVLERFLWRSNSTFAISKHYARFDVFKEAEANKNAGKYDNATIDAQVEFYRNEGMTPYSDKKLPIISDVPEGCVIVREHTPVTNLFGCLWFNEVDRFTSRDQISFGIIRDKVLAQIPWPASMFLDCERRNFVVQGYHRDVLLMRAARLLNGTANGRTKGRRTL